MLDLIFDSLRNDERIYVCTLPPSPVQRKLVASVPEAQAWADAHVEDNVFFGVAPRPLDDFNSVTRVTCLWADLDVEDYGSQENIESARSLFPAPPTFVMSSGHGCHLYWLLTRSIEPESAREVMRAIMDVLGSDPVHNPDRVMRFPESYNLKDPQAPIKTRIAEERRRAVFDARDLLKLTRMDRNTSQRMYRASRRGTRSEFDWHVIKVLQRHHVTFETATLLFQILPFGEKYWEQGDRYLRHSWDKSTEGDREDPTVGFRDEGGSIYYYSPKARKRLSTFVMEPTKILKVVGAEEDHIICNIRSPNQEGRTDGVQFPKSAFDSSQKFLRFLPNSLWQWLGTDTDTRKLLPYLMEKLLVDGDLPSTYGVSVIGRYQNYWVAPSMTLAQDRVFSPNEAPVIYLPTGRETPQLSYTFPSEEEYGHLVREISQLLPGINDDGSVACMLGWFLATPVKALLEEAGERFPILNIYGTQGSGKSSTILDVFHPLLGHTRSTSHSCRTTQFVLLSLFASTNGTPISFGEYRGHLYSPRQAQFLALVREAYDVGLHARGRPDRTTESYSLTAPVSVDGEDAFGASEGAAKERSVSVSLHPADIEEGSNHYNTYQSLVLLKLGDFAGRYIQRTLVETPATIRERFGRALALLRERIPEIIPDRIRRNLVVIMLGLELYNEHVIAYDGIPLEWHPRLFVSALNNALMRVGGDMGRTRILVDDFTEDIINEVALHGAEERQNFFYQYDPEENVLWFQFLPAFSWWVTRRRQAGKASLDRTAVQGQLRERVTEYATGPRRIGGTQCWGLRLGICKNFGFDIPERLELQQYNMEV